MRWSKAFIPTMKENPAEAETTCHRLMLKAGLIRMLTTGVYEYLPLGWKVLLKIAKIIREEMEIAGAQELLLPVLSPAEIWKETRRWDDFGAEMFRLKDRKERDLCLCPTHEEVITDLVRREIYSYRDLPQVWYQIQTKFRDEPRPRSAVLRARQFIMKDAYSMDVDEEGLQKSYQSQYSAYKSIFTRCGLKYFIVGASSGLMGGTGSQEFMVESPSGEDTVVICNSCDYAANLEIATSVCLPAEHSDESLEEVYTPQKKTVEEVSSFLHTHPNQLMKSLLYIVEDKPLFLLIRGDYEVQESKLISVLKTAIFRHAQPEEVTKLTGAKVGFISPIGIKNIPIMADLSLKGAQGMISGANKDDYHFRGINLNRDLTVDTYADIRLIKEGEACVNCGKPLRITPAIELGHVFKLGTKYSESLKANFTDLNGQEKSVVMGSYGIGLERIMAAAIEQHHDENGIIWPLSIAPYQVVITVLNMNHPQSVEVAEKIYKDLQTRKIEVLFDDRDERAGFKFKDADLIGIPFRITIGERALKEGKIEIRFRETQEITKISPEDAVGKINEFLTKN
ncbi:MAG: proline--tRNA ligase [Candidatus Edwardsbacteria bacterium]